MHVHKRGRVPYLRSVAPPPARGTIQQVRRRVSPATRVVILLAILGAVAYAGAIWTLAYHPQWLGLVTP